MLMKKANRNIAPDWIDHLSNCEVFVFGSNLAGEHRGGAARIAYENFGAEWGVGDGPTGRCYAIPTTFKNLEDIRPYVQKFIEYALAHPNQRFLLTRVGCGIAGFDDHDMCLLFEGCTDYPNVLDVPNIAVPKEWFPSLLIPYTLGLAVPKPSPVIEGAVSEERLKVLCDKYKYQIGAGVSKDIPSLRVRYVLDNGKFGYADFGNYFFLHDAFYVISTKDEDAANHDQDAMWTYFRDECEGRGYAVQRIFAGVPTGHVDVTGSEIYTGDVISMWRGKRDKHTHYTQLALGDWHIGEDDEYVFVLDNHCLGLEECYKQGINLERIGTVFFKLNEYDTISLRHRTMTFNGWRDTNEEHNHKVLMARYTPNFEQTDWKYDALDALEIEDFNWQH